MKTSIEKLIQTPLLTGELVTHARDNGTHAVQLNWVMASAYSDKKMVGVTGSEYELTPEALDCLAEQFHLASLQLRAIISDMDPGRRFEADQTLAFGVDRLEGENASL